MKNMNCFLSQPFSIFSERFLLLFCLTLLVLLGVSKAQTAPHYYCNESNFCSGLILNYQGVFIPNPECKCIKRNHRKSCIAWEKNCDLLADKGGMYSYGVMMIDPSFGMIHKLEVWGSEERVGITLEKQNNVAQESIWASERQKVKSQQEKEAHNEMWASRKRARSVSDKSEDDNKWASQRRERAKEVGVRRSIDEDRKEIGGQSREVGKRLTIDEHRENQLRENRPIIKYEGLTQFKAIIDAEKTLKEGCPSCETVISFRNGCAAVSWSEGTKKYYHALGEYSDYWTYLDTAGINPRLDEVEKKSLEKCRTEHADCVLLDSFCTRS